MTVASTETEESIEVLKREITQLKVEKKNLEEQVAKLQGTVYKNENVKKLEKVLLGLTEEDMVTLSNRTLFNFYTELDSEFSYAVDRACLKLKENVNLYIDELSGDEAELDDVAHLTEVLRIANVRPGTQAEVMTSVNRAQDELQLSISRWQQFGKSVSEIFERNFDLTDSEPRELNERREPCEPRELCEDPWVALTERKFL